MTYTPIEYVNVKGIDGWEVDTIYRHDDIVVDNIDDLSDRTLYKLFAAATGFKTALRAIDVVYQDEYFIEFIYTACSRDHYYPLGRLELKEDTMTEERQAIFNAYKGGEKIYADNNGNLATYDGWDYTDDDTGSLVNAVDRGEAYAVRWNVLGQYWIRD